MISKAVKILRRKAREWLDINVKSMLYLPSVSSEKHLSYLVNSIAFSIPYKSDLCIDIAVQDNLLGVDLYGLGICSFQGNFIKEKNLNHINLVKHSVWRLFSADIICINNINLSSKLFLFNYKIEVLDVNLKCTTTPEFYKVINWSFKRKTDRLNGILLSRKNLNRLIDEKKGAQKTTVFAGGPSLKQYKNFIFSSKDLNISVNDYVINDMDFFNYANIDVVCFSDSVLFFGASKYTKEFYDRLIRAFKTKPFYIFIDIKALDILRQYKIFDDYLIGTIRKTCRSYVLLSKDSLVTSMFPSGNILTSYAAILGLSITDKVVFLGSDGLNKNIENKVTTKNYSEARKYAYENYNLELPGIYNTYESALKSHEVYDANISKLISFANSYGKDIFTYLNSNYDSLKCLEYKEGVDKL